MVESAQLVSHGVKTPRNALAKCKAAQAGAFAMRSRARHRLDCHTRGRYSKTSFIPRRAMPSDAIMGNKCLEAGVRTSIPEAEVKFLAAHHVVSINDSHVRQQPVVCKWVLNAVVSISDDCKWSYLRNRYQKRLG